MRCNCFQYVTTIELNDEEIGSNPEITSNIKPFINKYKWDGIKCSPKKKDWKIFEQNNPTIALNVLCIKEMKMSPS